MKHFDRITRDNRHDICCQREDTGFTITIAISHTTETSVTMQMLKSINITQYELH